MNAKKIRRFAEHVALIVRRQDDVLTLSERYGDKKKIGSYRSWPAVEQALWRYTDEEIARIEAEMRAEGILHLHKPMRRAAPPSMHSNSCADN